MQLRGKQMENATGKGSVPYQGDGEIWMGFLKEVALAQALTEEDAFIPQDD
jgi:hypothetical protein